MGDRLEALGRGAAQTLTGGWNDEAVAWLLKNAMPDPDDKTGIPREYAGGQYEQYRDQQRADEAESQRAYPKNFAAGQILGAVPGTVATMATGGLPAVGLAAAQGAASGSGLSTANTGKELAKDTIRGAAVGGALASAGNAAQAAAPALKALWRQGPPKGPAPAMAGGAPSVSVPEAPVAPSVNMSKGGGAARPNRGFAGVKSLDPDEIAKAEFHEDPTVFDQPNSPHKYVVQADLKGDTPRVLKKYSLEPGEEGTEFVTDWGHLPINERDMLIDRATRELVAKGKTRTALAGDKPDEVIKRANSPKGVTANKNEAGTSRQHDAFMPVTGHADDYSTITQKRGKVLSDAELAQRLGLEGRFQKTMTDWQAGNFDKLPKNNPKWDAHQQMLDQLKKTNPDLEDLERANQWAVTPDDRLVIVDYAQRNHRVTPGKDPQLELALKEPAWAEHSAPGYAEVVESIDKQGLEPRKALTRKEPAVFMSDEKNRDFWRKWTRDAHAGDDPNPPPPVTYRAIVPAQQVPGAEKGLMVYEKPIPASRLQKLNNETGSWRPVVGPEEEAMEVLRSSPNQDWLPHVPTTEEWDFSKYLNQR